MEERDLWFDGAGRRSRGREGVQMGESGGEGGAPGIRRQGGHLGVPIAEPEGRDFADRNQPEVGFLENPTGHAHCFGEPPRHGSQVERFGAFDSKKPQRPSEVGISQAILLAEGHERTPILARIERERRRAPFQPAVTGRRVHCEDPVGNESLFGEADRRFGYRLEGEPSEAAVQFEKNRGSRRDQHAERPGLRLVPSRRGKPVEAPTHTRQRIEHVLAGVGRTTRAAVQRDRRSVRRVENDRVGGAAEAVHRRLDDPGGESGGHRGIRGVPARRENLATGTGGARGHRSYGAAVAGHPGAAGQGDLFDQRGGHPTSVGE